MSVAETITCDGLELEWVGQATRVDPQFDHHLVCVRFDVVNRRYHVVTADGCNCDKPFTDYLTLTDWGPPLTLLQAVRAVRESCPDVEDATPLVVVELMLTMRRHAAGVDAR